MPSNMISRPTALQRASSHTRTGRTPVKSEAMLIVGVPQTFQQLYAGPVDASRFPPQDPRFLGAVANYPSPLDALQVFAFNSNAGLPEVIARDPDPAIALLIDLGES